MPDEILVLDGEREIVTEFEKGLLQLGMTPIEIDTLSVVDDTIYNTGKHKDEADDISFESREFFGKKEESQYTIDSTAIVSSIVGLLGTGGLVTIVTTVINAHKGEGSVEFDEKGNIIKVTFKDMNPNKVPKLLEEISQCIREGRKLNSEVLIETAVTEEDNSQND